MTAVLRVRLGETFVDSEGFRIDFHACDLPTPTVYRVVVPWRARWADHLLGPAAPEHDPHTATAAALRMLARQLGRAVALCAEPTP